MPFWNDEILVAELAHTTSGSRILVRAFSKTQRWRFRIQAAPSQRLAILGLSALARMKCDSLILNGVGELLET
jgi:hypothetical protein